jgi:hypothetical protein
MSKTTKNGLYAVVFFGVAAVFFLFFVYVGYQEISAGHYSRGLRALILPAALVLAVLASFLKKSVVTESAVASPVIGVEQDTKDQQTATPASVRSRFDYGTIVFAAFSVLTLVVCLSNGVVPVYLAESIAWGVVAWYWHRKGPWSETATGIVLMLGVGVAAGEGYVVGRQSLGNNYTYLAQGDLHYRVDAASGRTDVLAGTKGWEPVSFNRPPETIPTEDARSIIVSNGSWENGTYTAGKICFDVQNGSHYVLQQVAISISLNPKPPEENCNLFDQMLGGGCEGVILKGGRPLDVGKAAQFCGDAPRPIANGTTWKYGTGTITGWKP